MKRPRAFTLIELLIVVAIMGMISASMLAFIQTPAEEHTFAVIENAMESGAALFFTHITSEAHRAKAIKSGSVGQSLALTGAGRNGLDVVYFVDSEKRLRRVETPHEEARKILDGTSAKTVVPLGAALLSHVQHIGVEPNGANGLYTITLRAETSRLARNMKIDRSVETHVGNAWMGETP